MLPAINLTRAETDLLENASRWTDAMQQMGKEAVDAELARRPGRPADRVLDIVLDPPHPTRDFCQQWCAEQENITFRFSMSTGIILMLVVLITGCLVQVFTLGFGPHEPPSAMAAAASARAARAGGGGRGAQQMMSAGMQQGPFPHAPAFRSATPTASSGNNSQSSMPSSMQPLMPSLSSPLGPSASSAATSAAASSSASSSSSNTSTQQQTSQ